MDPFTAMGLLGGLVLPAIGPALAAAGIGGVTPVMAGIGTAALGTGSAVSGLGLGAAAAANPFTVAGMQAGSADAYNNAAGAVANVVNPLNIPGVHIHVN